MSAKVTYEASYIRDPLERRKMLGEQIKTRRQVLRLSREDLSKMIGCSESTVRNIERGNVEISVTRLYELAEVLGTNISFLLSLREIPIAGKDVVLNYHNSFTKEAAELKDLQILLNGCGDLVYARRGEMTRQDIFHSVSGKKKRTDEVMKEQKRAAQLS